MSDSKETQRMKKSSSSEKLWQESKQKHQQRMRSNSVVKREGWMNIKKDKKFVISKWKQCWFELDELNEFITYYNQERSLGPLKSKMLGSISLESAKIEEDPKDNKKIIIKTAKGKIYHLETASEQDRNEWIAAMNKVREFAQTSAQLLEEWKKDTQTHKCLSELSTILEQDETAESLDDEKETDLSTIYVEDLGGNRVGFNDIVGNQVTVLFLLRHFGCVACRRATGHCLQRLEQFEDLGINLVAIGNGSPVYAKLFKKEFKFPGKIYVDQELSLYKAFNCKRGLKYVVSLKSLSEVKNALLEGYKPGSIQGDPLQLGGVFVYTKKHGIIFEHIENYTGNMPDLDLMVECLETYCKLFPADSWAAVDELELWAKDPSLPFKKDDLTKTTSNTNINSMSSSNTNVDKKEKEKEVLGGGGGGGKEIVMISPNCVAKGYRCEVGSLDDKDHSNVDLTEPMLLNDTTYYLDFFYKREHSLWISSGDGTTGPFLIISAFFERSRDRRCLIFHKNGITKRVVPYHRCQTEKDMLRYLTLKTFGVDAVATLRQVEGDISRHIIEFEKRFHVCRYKVGVLYVKDGQCTENDFYSNNTNLSEDYLEFLKFLGQEIEIEGWDKWDGGVTTDGARAVYAEYHGKEVLFHVSTLLPFSDEEDSQQLERKKYIGNDVVVVVYKEGIQPFDPTVIKSHFNHVFIIIQREPSTDPEKKFYRVAVVTKPNVPQCPPHLMNPIFEKNDELRNFLFSKIINSEIATMTRVPIFRSKLCEMRTDMLNTMTTLALTAPPQNKEKESTINIKHENDLRDDRKRSTTPKQHPGSENYTKKSRLKNVEGNSSQTLSEQQDTKGTSKDKIEKRAHSNQNNDVVEHNTSSSKRKHDTSEPTSLTSASKQRNSPIAPTTTTL